MTTGPRNIVRLTPRDVSRMRELLTVYAAAFELVDDYAAAPPGDAYLERLLSDDTFIALAAIVGGRVVGGLTAYELRKYERERSEVYIYDIAVAEAHRRRGIATALITALKPIAAGRGAWVVFVQADRDDPPAIALYTKLGAREDVLHFDIDVT